MSASKNHSVIKMNNGVSTIHLPEIKQFHVLPFKERLSESETDMISHQLNLENFVCHEKQVQKWSRKKQSFIFDYYLYIFQY
jgi:hypothetical protein